MSHTPALMDLQAAAASLSPSWWDVFIRYALASLVGYIGAAIQFGRKLEARDKAMNGRLDKLDGDVRQIAAEVWGPKGESGLRKDVGELQKEIGAQSKLLTEILTTVRMLHEKLTQ